MGPEISDLTPAHGTIQRSNELNISFTARDEMSGLRHDAEQVLSEGPNYPGGDGDDPPCRTWTRTTSRATEPISEKDGSSTDINVWYEAEEGRATPAVEAPWMQTRQQLQPGTGRQQWRTRRTSR